MDTRLAPATLPPGRRVYAIGDVHGCAERLAALHDAIDAHLSIAPIAAPLVIHLGDLIDRGPDSAGVIARLLRPWRGRSGQRPFVINLTGNHEAMMLAALASADRVGKTRGTAAHWLANGGEAALASWGVDPATNPAAWSTVIPEAHLNVLRGLAVSHREGGYFFVHAGIRPGVALESQAREDMLWIRDPFLTWTGTLPAVVVHGHTPTDTPVVRANRIGIDTGAVMGGRLTCVVLEGDRLGFLQA